MKETVKEEVKKSIFNKINSKVKENADKINIVKDKVSKPVKERVESYGKLDKVVKQDLKKAAIVGAGFIVGVLFS